MTVFEIESVTDRRAQIRPKTWRRWDRVACLSWRLAEYEKASGMFATQPRVRIEPMLCCLSRGHHGAHRTRPVGNPSLEWDAEPLSLVRKVSE